MTTLTTMPKTTPPDAPTDEDQSCPGCPRCRDSDAPFCSIPHPKFDGRHPRCRNPRCGHCVLNGEHEDTTDDLETHPGFPRGHGGGMAPIQVN